MDEGVVLWDSERQVVLMNPAAVRLWGAEPDPQRIAERAAPTGSCVLSRGRRHLEITVTDLDRGQLAILRDISAELELDRRRQEMQRLVSHELKTPLSSIAGFGETLERYELSRDEQQRVASLIRGEARQLQDMVVAFLDLERLGGGHWEGAAEEADLGTLVAGRLEILEAAARGRGLELSRSIAEGCRAKVVPALLERLVDNLVGNAITYSSPGDRIEVEVFSGDDQVHLVVRDHGPGIPETSLTRIFDRFYRVPGTDRSGAGLGLALVKEVVDWHGGCLTVESTLAAGSTFCVRLPAAKAGKGGVRGAIDVHSGG
jgi:signal transduction histidine kinase